jgi:hypothetical protein
MGNAQSHDEDKNESTGDSHALYSSNKIHFTNLTIEVPDANHAILPSIQQKNAITQPKNATPPSTQSDNVTPPSAQPKNVTQPSAQPKNVTQPSTQLKNVTQPSTQSENITQPSTQSENITPPSTQSENITPPSTQPENTTPPSTQPENVITPSTQSENITPPTQPENVITPSTQSENITPPPLPDLEISLPGLNISMSEADISHTKPENILQEVSPTNPEIVYEMPLQNSEKINSTLQRSTVLRPKNSCCLIL